MSSELERLLKQGRDALPEPTPEATERARTRALAALRSGRPRRLRVAVLAGAAVVVAAALGIGLGAALTPSGEAAKGPVGLGFLPENGWLVYQSGAKATADQPALAVASNLPLDSEDVVGGLAEPSALPYATLLDLPKSGIVLVASFRARGEEVYDRLFPETKLPLRLADASSYIDSGTQVRPADPLGQRQLRGAVGGYNIDLTAYFGVTRPSPELLAKAQRQIERLAVSAARPTDTDETLAPARRAASTEVVDRTFACPTAMVGGLYGIEARAHSGVRQGASGWAQLPFALVDTGHSGGGTHDPRLLANALAWVTAGKPSSITTIDSEWRKLPVREAGTLGLNVSTCKKSAKRIPLSRAGLRGGAAGPVTESFFCEGSRRVIVRVRATLVGAATLRPSLGIQRTLATVREARMAVRTTKGAKLVYAETRGTGVARLFTAPRCEAK
ncbi:MAG TPA: hypothetical protein VLA22_04630 [Gaiellaceae bacterium]|nr:hypothetical protein [Gaiellaceae bacterium]